MPEMFQTFLRIASVLVAQRKGTQGVCGGAELTLCPRQPLCSCALLCVFPGAARLLYDTRPAQ